jgi:hypothetical protein
LLGGSLPKMEDEFGSSVDEEDELDDADPEDMP